MTDEEHLREVIREREHTIKALHGNADAMERRIWELEARAEAAEKRVKELEAVLERIAAESMDYQYVARAALEAQP